MAVATVQEATARHDPVGPPFVAIVGKHTQIFSCSDYIAFLQNAVENPSLLPLVVGEPQNDLSLPMLQVAAVPPSPLRQT